MTTLLPPPPPPLPPPPPAPIEPVTFDDPPPPPDLVVGQGRRGRRPVPYLGEDPAPSRSMGLALQLTCVGAAVTWLLRALVHLQQWRQDQNLVEDAQLGVPFTVQPESGTDLAPLLVTLSWWAIAGAVVCDLVWRRSRRPNQIRTARGEAHVELPLSWLVPRWFPVLVAAAVAVGALGMSQGTVDGQTLVNEIPTARLWSVVGSVGWVVVWALVALLPRFANRAQARRVEWSAPYRERPETVPYLPPLKGEGDQLLEEGFGWVLRTGGLVVGAMVCPFLVLGGLSELSDGNRGGGGWLLAGLALGWLVGRAFVRRSQRRRQPAGA
jgi:hypothetical protein